MNNMFVYSTLCNQFECKGYALIKIEIEYKNYVLVLYALHVCSLAAGLQLY